VIAFIILKHTRVRSSASGY